MKKAIRGQFFSVPQRISQNADASPRRLPSGEHESRLARKEKVMKTNAELQHDVLEELQYEPSVNSARIGVGAKDGIVTLNGAVTSYAEKLATARAAERVGGVRAVVDELRVELP